MITSKERPRRRTRRKKSITTLPAVAADEAIDALLPEAKRKIPDTIIFDDMPAAEKPPVDAEEEMKKKPFYKQWTRKFSKSVLEVLGEDWLYLVLLGVVMGIFSFAIDIGITKLRFLHFHIFRETDSIHWTLQYATWVLFSLVLILAAAALCHFLAPQAVGSGIPELKTILRGVVLKEYLTFRTLVTKLAGLVMALGSGLPLGKEGPFVHIASMLARLLSKLVFSFQGIYENESRSSEMLAAAAAVGVASTYGAAVGGVLFSIEVTSVFFPLRNYWRGFLATVSSAVVFRLLAVWFEEQDTVVAFSTTFFPSDYPFDPKELFMFVFIGLICGFGGALFVWFHRKYVELVLQNKRIKAILEKNFFIYPAFVTFVIASLKCPLGYGKFFAGGLTPREALGNLFSNFSWNDPGVNNTEAEELLAFWAKGTSSIFVVLALYAINMFWMTAIAITLPVPCGVFIPLFVSGAAFGRLIGETMYILFPNGVRTDGIVTKIVPGAYALVGATAFSGAVTHAISVSVIVVEITGQIIYILPITLAVLLANAVCARLQPSIYDSIIRLKKLPYLPRILPTSSSVHKVYAGDICVRDVKFVSLSSTYREIQDLLIAMPKLKSFPLVDRPSSAILLGSVRRGQMDKLLEAHVGDESRHSEAERRRRQNKAGKFVVPVVTLEKEKIALSTDDIPVERKESRFQVRRVRSDEFLNVDENAVPLHRKDGLQQNATTGDKAGDKENDKEAENPLLSLPQTSSQQQNGSYSQPGTIHAVTSKKFLDTVHAVGNYMHSLPQKLRMSLRRGVPTVYHYECDLSPLERKEWENKQLDQRLDFDRITIDPAPFQLVERTSLYKVHSLFWLLGLNRAYVTCLGRLVGVVALRELRQTLERTEPVNLQKGMRKRKATFDGSTMSRPHWRAPLQKFASRPNWFKTSSLRSRMASIAPSVTLIPGQSEAINVSLPSTPDSSRRASPIKEGDCLSEVDENDLSDEDRSRGDVLNDGGVFPVESYYGNTGANGGSSDDGDVDEDRDYRKNSRSGKRDSMFSEA